jgi:cytochrome P450
MCREHEKATRTGGRSPAYATGPRRKVMRMEDFHYDPLNPAVIADPYPHYAALRRAGPVHTVASLGITVVSRHADVEHALRRPELFSSSPYREFIRAAMEIGGAGDRTTGETLLGSDPPLHTRLRKIVNRGFSSTRVKNALPVIESIAHDLVADFVARGEGDFVSSVAAPLPVKVIAGILGVEPERHLDFKRWSDHLILATTGVLSDDERKGLERTFIEMNAYVDATVARRRRRPTDDLISDLLRAERGEEAMGVAEVRTFVPLLLIAGNEATSHLIANAAMLLAKHPHTLARLRDDAGFARKFVEETLRYDAPVQMILRRLVAPTMIGGTPIGKDTMIGLLLGSANRDDRRFAHAERFDPDREAGGHLTFGAGIHFCLGAELSRMEAVVLLQALARAVDRIEVLDEKVEYPASFLVRGPKRLHLRVRPKAHTNALRA